MSLLELAFDGVFIRGARENISTEASFDLGESTIQSQKMSNILENLTTIQFARQGDLMVQNPSRPFNGLFPPGGRDKSPDLAFANVPELADVASIQSATPAPNALRNALRKVVNGQAQRIVINLDRSQLDIDSLRAVLSETEVNSGRTWLELIEDGEPLVSQLDAVTLVSRIDVLDGGEISTLYSRN